MNPASTAPLPTGGFHSNADGPTSPKPEAIAPAAGSSSPSASPVNGDAANDFISKRDTAGRPDSSILPPRDPVVGFPSKASFLQRRSFEFTVYSVSLVLAVSYLGFYNVGRISYDHYEELKVNLRPPWLLYRWLGSKGVDVTDKQWYFFVVALPPAMPLLAFYLYLSHRLRRGALSVAMVYQSSPGPRGAPKATTAADGLAGGALGEANVTTAVASSSPPPPVKAFNESERASPPPAEGNESSGKAVVYVTAADATVKGGSTAVTIITDDAAPISRGKRSGVSGPPTLASPTTGNVSAVPSVFVRRNLTPVYWLHITFGVVLAVLLFGPGAFFELALVVLNYFCIAQLHRYVSFRVRMAIMWVYHIGLLFLNHYGDGYRFAWFGLSFLDDMWTPFIHWTTHYNMSVLRMIAFNNDLWEALSSGEERRQRALAKHERLCVACALIRDQNRHIVGLQPESLLCTKCRTECPRPVQEYAFLSYLGYVYYLPLFVAGPMSSFNAYISYLHFPTRAMSKAALTRYGLRALGNMVYLCTLMHYNYIMAILLTPSLEEQQKAAAAAGKMSSTTFRPTLTDTSIAVIDQLHLTDKAIVAFLTLAFIWSKFNVIWKFFRFYALLDGFDPPEDMPRCFANTTTIQGFWRDWHASFNLWIVRYMYIPMGGRQRILFSIFPIFFFIAIWHDIELRLVYWAFLISFCFVPEVIITTFFSSKRNPFVLRVKRKARLWRYLRAVACQIGMFALIIANLVGFSMGAARSGNGLRDLAAQMSWKFRLWTPYFFFCAANIAVQDRDQKAYEQQCLKIKFNLQ